MFQLTEYEVPFYVIIAQTQTMPWMKELDFLSPKWRLYKKEYAHELIRAARNDYYAGCELSESKIVRQETVLVQRQ